MIFQMLSVMFANLPAGHLVGRLQRNGSQLYMNGQPYAGIGVNVVDVLWNNNSKGLFDAAERGFHFARFAAAPYYWDGLIAWKLNPE